MAPATFWSYALNGDDDENIPPSRRTTRSPVLRVTRTQSPHNHPPAKTAPRLIVPADTKRGMGAATIPSPKKPATALSKNAAACELSPRLKASAALTSPRLSIPAALFGGQPIRPLMLSPRLSVPAAIPTTQLSPRLSVNPASRVHAVRDHSPMMSSMEVDRPVLKRSLVLARAEGFNPTRLKVARSAVKPFVPYGSLHSTRSGHPTSPALQHAPRSVQLAQGSDSHPRLKIHLAESEITPADTSIAPVQQYQASVATLFSWTLALVVKFAEMGFSRSRVKKVLESLHGEDLCQSSTVNVALDMLLQMETKDK